MINFVPNVIVVFNPKLFIFGSGVYTHLNRFVISNPVWHIYSTQNRVVADSWEYYFNSYALRLVLIVFSTTFKPFGLGLSLVGVPRLIPQCLPPTHACGGHTLPSASTYRTLNCSSSSGLKAARFSINFPTVVDFAAINTVGFPIFFSGLDYIIIGFN